MSISEGPLLITVLNLELKLLSKLAPGLLSISIVTAFLEDLTPIVSCGFKFEIYIYENFYSNN